MPAAPKSPQFKQHPTPLGGSSLLSADSFLVQGAANGDTLLVAPPSATDTDANGGQVVRMISPTTAVPVRVTNVAGLLLADVFSLVYKAEGGREVVLDSNTGVVAQGALVTLNPSCFFAMSPNDLGLFLRLTEAVPGPGRLDASVQVFDVRGPTRSATDVDAVEAIVAAGGSAANAETIFENTSDSDVEVSIFSEEIASGAILNFDPLTAHTYQLFLTDGTTTIEITNTAVPPSVAAGSSAVLAPIAIPPGWSLKMSLGQAVVTFAPRVVLNTAKTNFDVARNNQAGAY